MPLSTGFRHPLGNGFLTEANDGDGYFVFTQFDQYNPDFNAYHLGEDWAGEGGLNTDLGDPVFAISNGTVTERGFLDSFGNYVIIRHDLPSPITVNGITTSVVYSLYGHLQNPSIVSVGQDVSIGQQIGNVGFTGMADGVGHVHLEIRLGSGAGYDNTDGYAFNGAPAGWVDPTDFINTHRTVTPFLTSITPADDAIAVPASSNIVLTFNEAVTAGTGNFLLYNANGTLARSIAVTDASQVSFSGGTVTINPSTDLVAGASYYVNFGAGVIRDFAGNSFAGFSGTTAFNFMTLGPDLAGNTLASARDITLGSSPTRYSDYVGPSDPRDYYKFTTTETTSFSLHLTGLVDDADVYLLNASGAELAHSWNSGLWPEAINVASLAAGTYYIQVRAYNTASTNYVLEASAAPVNIPDYAGNTLATARAISVSGSTSTYNDYVGPTDATDYYKFTTSGTTKFSLNLTGLSADADVYLLNSSGAEVAHSYNFGTTPEAINIASLAAGTYYVQVRPYQTAATNYTLSLSAAAADTSAPQLLSVSPADNATEVAVGSNIVLTFDEAITAGSGNISIYNADGTLARSIAVTDASQVSFAGNTVTINPSADLAPNSSYYVNLAAGVIKDLAGNNYAGIAGTTAFNFATVTTADLAGNTLASARAVTLGSTSSSYTDYVGPSDPEDYYKFTVTNPTKLSLHLTGLSDDADLYLLNSSGAEVAHSYAFGSTPEAIDVASLAAGTYYVHVHAYNTASTSYVLDMTGVPL